MPPAGALLGLIVGGGLVLAWSRLPFRRRPMLDARLSPYIGEPSADNARRHYLQDAGARFHVTVQEGIR